MSTSERTRVVVVDDYPDGRGLTSTILRHEGFEVKEAATGHEALALAVERPSLMVLDVNLPDIDGFEVCRRLKSNPQTAAISVLHLSAAHRGVEDRVRGLEGGADAYLTLPVERHELVATVRALLRIRRAETELRASQERYARLLDGALEGVWRVDAEAHTLYVNRRLAAMLGYEAADLLGRPMGDFMDDGGRRDLPRQIEAWRRGDHGLQDVRFVRRDGSALWTLVSAIVTLTNERQFDGAVVLVADATEHRRAEAAERESDSLRAVTELANAAAHEINNPLAVITGQLYFLNRELPGPSPRLQAMEESAARIRTIVLSMLTVTRREVSTVNADLPPMLDLRRSSDRPGR